MILTLLFILNQETKTLQERGCVSGDIEMCERICQDRRYEKECDQDIESYKNQMDKNDYNQEFKNESDKEIEE